MPKAFDASPEIITYCDYFDLLLIFNLDKDTT